MTKKLMKDQVQNKTQTLGAAGITNTAILRRTRGSGRKLKNNIKGDSSAHGTKPRQRSRLFSKKNSQLESSLVGNANKCLYINSDAVVVKPPNTGIKVTKQADNYTCSENWF